ncbi:bacteriophage abortive infection AbiH family protein [Streptococcus suis]|nr:bacteriophage abortive infection AbiH family protein [Streptococcus suis]MBY5039108.1 bacteriophage abortive infection AbiH family protein [Streptococcus suis]
MTEEVQKYVVVGNGFDLNLGIKSSYGDFVEYIKLRKRFNDDAELSEYNQLFQKRENFGIKNWSDFESELEKRTFELQTWNSPTSNPMNAYVEMAELNAAITQLEQEFYTYLSEQLIEWQGKYLEPYVTHDYMKIFDGSVVINFNYTDSPNILGLVDVNYYYSVHGSLKNNDIIFGGGFVGHEKSRTVWVPESFKNDKLVRVKQNAYLAEERAKLIDNINHSKKFDLYILGHSLVGTDLLFLETLLVGARRIYLYYHQEDYLPKIEELIKKYDRDMIEKIKLVPFTKIILDKEGD